jgi:hypothetical protein
MNGKRMILILMLTLMIALAGRLSPQQDKTTTATTTQPAATATTAPAVDPALPFDRRNNSHEVREELRGLLRTHPPQLAVILATDPSLLSDDAFLAHYPDLAGFVATHPDVRHQSAFYVDEFAPEQTNARSVERMLEPLFSVGAMLIVVFGLSWVIRTLVDQKRWSRLAKTQSEVHNKILDRFGTSTELLEYMKTPAGARFLESAPIPLPGDSGRPAAPVARVLASIQLGVIISAAAVGMLFVATRFSKEAGDGMFAIGMIALCIGLGFIASAIVSLVLTRRLGASAQATELLSANQ